MCLFSSIALSKSMALGVRDFAPSIMGPSSLASVPVPDDFPSPCKYECSRGPKVLDSPEVFKFSKSRESARGGKSA